MLVGNGVLLVLDNLETLLTPDGSWRDPRWGPLIVALTEHAGESRVILTSHIPLAGRGQETLTLPVHALSLAEAAALVRDLPNLRALLYEDSRLIPALRAVDQDRERVRRVLRVVQGHPKLLELADAAAVKRDRLDAQLATAEAAAAGQQLEASFRDGESTLDPGQFLAAFTAWTQTALTVMPEPAWLLAQFVAFLEEDDRQLAVIEANWEYLWRRLELPGDPPGLQSLLDTLTTAALIQANTPAAAAGGGQGHAENDGQPSAVPYRMHPGVAAAIAAYAPPEIRAASDTEVAAFWETIADQAVQEDDREDSALIVRAGLSAAPYLQRCRDWDSAGRLLEMALSRDQSLGTVQAVLPSLRRIADATRTSMHEANLGRALSGAARVSQPSPLEGSSRENKNKPICRSDSQHRRIYCSCDSPGAGQHRSEDQPTGRSYRLRSRCSAAHGWRR